MSPKAERSQGGPGRLALAAAASLVGMALLAAPAGALPPHVWLGADGEPLPFQDDAAIEAFLREARVVSGEEIGVGINRTEKLLLERDGVQAHAVFRDVDREEESVAVGDRLYRRFKDSHTGECAAYALARLLGLDNVPPTVARFVDGRRGSLQIWVENARDPGAEGFSPPAPLDWVSQVWDMHVFDNLIFNADRNPGNVLADDRYRLWLVDHTRAFQPRVELLAPDRVERVRRELWARLLETTAEELADATREFLDPGQVAALKARRDLLVEHIESLIEERGEAAALH